MRRKPSILTLLLGQEIQYTLLMVAILAAAIAVKQLSALEPEPAPPPEPIEEAYLLTLLANRNAELERQVETMADELASRPETTDQPPIIFLSEADGFSFASGSSEISADFAARIRDEVTPRLVELTRRYGADVIEVIGHTDGVPLGPVRRDANLDARLPGALDGGAPAQLHPYDNVGLGMTRAIAVARLIGAGALPPGLKVLPLSAGSLIARGDRLDPASAERGEAERRRIEIRLRRTKE